MFYLKYGYGLHETKLKPPLLMETANELDAKVYVCDTILQDTLFQVHTLEMITDDVCKINGVYHYNLKTGDLC